MTPLAFDLMRDLTTPGEFQPRIIPAISDRCSTDRRDFYGTDGIGRTATACTGGACTASAGAELQSVMASMRRDVETLSRKQAQQRRKLGKRAA